MSEELMQDQSATYQSTEATPDVNNEQPIQQELTQEDPPATTQDDNFFEVKYNKEAVRVSYDEAPDYIQKGMNYEKVQSKANEFEQHLQTVAQLAGYGSHEELLQALQLEQQQREQQKYYDAGIDPETFNSLLEQHPDIQYAREMKQQEEEKQKFNEEAQEFFAEFPEVQEVPPEVWKLKEEKGLSLLDSYLRINYKSLGQQKEQEAIQKLQTNALSSPGALGDGAEHKVGYSNLSSADKKALRERVLRGENVQF
ncbi:hypothetical protein [Metabacillus sp. cB07]|uniref:hypothetical protein n=1 Tax=Metabacillus sp. cB07 TaxID=2806989 RepID=UPI00193964F1|nr:hypothetical protein [Metabacillus sp. cB07]